MGFSENIKKFNKTNQLTEGWYWLASTKNLKVGKAIGAKFWDKNFVVFRGEDKKVRVMDAYCPHMGAHLKEGTVEKNSIRCMFHYWKFNEKGECSDIPCQKNIKGIPKIKVWKTEEKYGLVWIWTGSESSTETIPIIPELSTFKMDWTHGNSFTKPCHPNVVMINAIDAQHFSSVHNLIVDMNLEPNTLSDNCIQFTNTERLPEDKWYKKLINKFYENAITYELTYWYGSTGSVMVGPKFLHFYIIFALRPTLDGKAEGQTLLVTKHRSGFIGKIINPIILFLTKLVGNYFAKGDTVIFNSINFNLKTPIKADKAIINFIQHLEKQPESAWTKKNNVDEKLINTKFKRNNSFLDLPM